MSQWLIGVHQQSKQPTQEYFVVRVATLAVPENGEVNKPTAPPEINPAVAGKEVETPEQFQFACDKCGKKFHIRRQHVGKSGKCKKCGHFMVIGKALVASR